MKPKLRILLDTNIYDILVMEKDFSFVESLKGRVIVYGSKVIRDELRDTPKSKKWRGRRARTLLLNTYDFIIGKHNLSISEPVNSLAFQYWKLYRGVQAYSKIINDFLIVACASIHGLDIVCTADRRTMKAKNCLQIYKTVNGKNNLPTPHFIEFSQFEKLI